MMARLAGIAAVFATLGLELAAQSAQPSLRILLPANGTVVRPGQKLMVSVTGQGEYPEILVAGESVAGIKEAPLGKPPWLIPVEIGPIDPGKTSFLAVSTTVSGTEVASNKVEIDVEPDEIPPIHFLDQILLVPVGGCLSLTYEGQCVGVWVFIVGKYDDGTEANMNNSTRLNPVSQAPSIAAVSPDGSTLIGVSPGTTKLVVFGKYSIDVRVYR
jgi:hypothetical protein